MVNVDKLRRLFEAYRDFDDVLFQKTAQSIIEESVATNRMVEARDLKKALGDGTLTSLKHSKQATLVPLSSRNDSSLLKLEESTIHRGQLVLTEGAQKKIDRILQEHRSKTALHGSGLKAKSRILFWGPPGCGKTLTSKYLAYELGLPIAVVQLSSLISSYLGDTSTHLRKIFEFINNKPVVLLLDEFDAVGKSRSDKQDVGEVKRVVNSLLQLFDAYASDKSIIIAASNYQDILDEALWRRFDDIVSFEKPNKIERTRFLEMLLRDIKVEGSLSKISMAMNNLSFAEIEKVVQEAMKTVVIRGEKKLTDKELASHLAQYKNDILRARGAPSSSKKK